MRAVIYARVSSTAQRDAQTIEGQLVALPPFVKSQGWELVNTYVDDGRSAKTGMLDRRDAWHQLLKDAEAGRFDVLVVVDVNRLTRTNSIEERAQILGPFQRLGISIATPSTGIQDLRSFFGEFFVTMKALVAAEEQRARTEAIVRGKQRAIGNGKKPSGPTPYGYRYDRATGAWTVQGDEAAIVRELFVRASAGETGNAIAEDLRHRGVVRPKGGVWLASRVYQTLRQTAYRGEWIVDKARKLTIPTPAIVEPALWFEVASRHSSTVRRGPAMRRTKHEYLLEGLAVCALCGARIGIATGTKLRGRGGCSPPRYVCANRRRVPIGGGRCALPYLETAELDERVWRSIAGLVLEPGRLERVGRDIQAEATTDDVVWLGDAKDAERRLARIERTTEAIVARFSRGLISEAVMDTQLEPLKAERAMAQQQLAAAHRARFASARAAARGHALSEMSEEMRQRAKDAPPAKRRELVEHLLKPGAVRVSIAEVVLEVNIKRKPPKELAGPRGVVGYSSELETSITIRLVA